MFSLTRLALVASVLPFVLATNNDCGSGFFKYANRNVCVRDGGNNTPDAGTAPAGVTCPSGNWYWSKSSKCCNPSSSNHNDNPGCPTGFTFNKSGSACIKTPTSPNKPEECKSGEFFWDARKCCLPSGGSPSPPQPPSGTKCPSNWSWHSGNRCCTPHNPPTPSKPPTCPGGWDWCDEIKQCQPHPPTPGNPQPSTHPKPKRSLKSRAADMCGAGLEACPIKTASGLFADFECIDTKVEAESCGGCSSTGKGKDCTVEIPNAFSVGCKNSTCVLHKCKVGYAVSEDGTSCVPELNVAARRDF